MVSDTIYSATLGSGCTSWTISKELGIGNDCCVPDLGPGTVQYSSYMKVTESHFVSLISCTIRIRIALEFYSMIEFHCLTPAPGGQQSYSVC
jgi:hypothetical protein